MRASVSIDAPAPSFFSSLIVAPPLPIIAGIISSETSMDMTFDWNSSIFFATRLLPRSIIQRLHFRMSFGDPSFEPPLSKTRSTPPASGWPTARALLSDRSNTLMPAPDLLSSSLFIKASTTKDSSNSSFSKSSLSTSAIAASTFSEGPMMRRFDLSAPSFDTSITTPCFSLMLWIAPPVFPTTRDNSFPTNKRDCETIWTCPISFLAFSTLSGWPRIVITLDSTSILTPGLSHLILIRTADCCVSR
mmetsp:Transcript_14528/g.31550  ORF Transcript_14528/g.31550 Transcript_14528/m.31550 type:complete len:247 (+) Transcript_14528:2448-3188(+)